MNPAYIAIIVIFIVLFVQRHNNTVWIKQFIKAKRLEGNTQMLELAKSFIGKECMIYTITHIAAIRRDKRSERQRDPS